MFSPKACKPEPGVKSALAFLGGSRLELRRNLSLEVASLQDVQAEVGEESAATDSVTLVQDVRCWCLRGTSVMVQGVESSFWNEDAYFKRVNWKKKDRIEYTVVEEEQGTKELLLEDFPQPGGTVFRL